MKVSISLFFSMAAFFAALADGPKNIILFIGDGMSTPQRMIAEEFSVIKSGAKLKMNHLRHQATTRTSSSDSLITDSAAAATAIACGVKTYNGAIGVDPDRKKVFSSATAAARSGRRVGIVTSVPLNHATPAGFYGHRNSRGDGYGLGLDLVGSGFDYFAGGALSGHDNKKHGEYRGDIYALAAEKGYRVVRGGSREFSSIGKGCGKVLFAVREGSLPYSIDGGSRPSVPTLAELTAKGIELLDNANGFFLMVEGGKIDWAGHANDAAANLHDVLALDEAVSVALSFAEKNSDTLVIVTGDHETGGMTMGFAGTGYKMHLDRLMKQKCSTSKFSAELAASKPSSFEEAAALAAEKYGLVFGSLGDPMSVAGDEAEMLKKAFDDDVKKNRGWKRFPAAVNSVFSHKCGIGWTSGAHTALPVLTTATGPGAEKFNGFLDNTDIAKITKALLERD